MAEYAMVSWCASVMWMQEKFFKPVALLCGHVFCQLCACEAAGIPSTFGLRHASKTKKCPVCRQAGVYCAAMELREVALMLKKEYVTSPWALTYAHSLGVSPTGCAPAPLFGFLVPPHKRPDLPPLFEHLICGSLPRPLYIPSITNNNMVSHVWLQGPTVLECKE